LRIVFAGTPVFAEKALYALVNRAQSVVAVYTQPDRPAGRGMKLTPSPVKELALAHNLTVLQPVSLKSPEAQQALAKLQPDLMVVAAYGLILPQTVLDIPKHGCLNIHASLLPRWRGAAPIHRAILAGDRESGIAIMRMEAGLDTGPVLLERRTPIAENETTGSLHDRLAALGADAIVEVVTRLAAGERIAEIAQPNEGVTYASKITPAEAQIDWHQPAIEIERQIRAFNPAPGAWTTWRGEKLKVLAGSVVPSTLSLAALPSDDRVGTVLRCDSEFWVRCGAASVLALTEVQRAGGKRIAASAWLSGGVHPQINERLGDNVE
jgi:methionyl-tRNA formyltransferase